jgi:hypothetical protein
VIVDKYGRVAGSIDLATLADMYEQATDDDLKAHYRQVAGENGLDLDEATEASEPEAEPEDQAPPRAGKGSGRDEWAAYAESVGLDVDDDMTRDEIIAAVEE